LRPIHGLAQRKTEVSLDHERLPVERAMQNARTHRITTWASAKINGSGRWPADCLVVNGVYFGLIGAGCTRRFRRNQRRRVVLLDYGEIGDPPSSVVGIYGWRRNGLCWSCLPRMAANSLTSVRLSLEAMDNGEIGRVGRAREITAKWLTHLRPSLEAMDNGEIVGVGRASPRF
jgi:hypothetical protein